MICIIEEKQLCMVLFEQLITIKKYINLMDIHVICFIRNLFIRNY